MIEIRFIIEQNSPRIRRREEAFKQNLQKKAKRWFWQRRRQLQWRELKVKSKSQWQRLAPAVAVALGSLIISSALGPIITHLVFTSPLLQQQKLVSGLPDIPMVREIPSVPTAEARTAEQEKPRVIVNELDYTDLNNWFPEPQTWHSDQVIEYTLHIPKLDIANAVIKVGGTNLDISLIQYPGTSMPGDLGAPVIFGHSVLRQFYSPSELNPRRYYSIFSKIMTLQPGDEIFVDYDGIRYLYTVTKKAEVKPEDTFILEQDYSARQLKIVTCVPEGTYLRRGVVLAQLEKIE